MGSFGLIAVNGNTSGSSRVVVYDINGKVKFPSGGGTGTVTSVGFLAGAGISLAGTNPITTSGIITIINSAPDQVVVLTAGTAISITGAYPNFTIDALVFTSLLPGIVPASGGGTANFLRADGAWVPPPASPITSFTPGVITVTPSTRQNNYNPVGLSTATTIILNPTTHIVISGLQGGADGRIINIVNVSQYLVILENQGTTSSATNRFTFPESFPRYLTPSKSVTLIYSTVTNNWQCLDQTPAFTAFEDFYQEVAPTLQMGYTAWHTQVGGTVTGGVSVGMPQCLGAIGLNTNTTSAIGNAKVSMVQRTGTLVGGSSTFYLSCARIGLKDYPTVADNYTLAVGMGQNGIGTWSPTARGAYWAIDLAQNATNYYMAYGSFVATKVNSTVPFTTNSYITLGVFTRNLAEACFFYSTDGITYNIEYSVVSLIGGSPLSLVGIWSSASLVNKRVTVDYLAASFNLVR